MKILVSTFLSALLIFGLSSFELRASGSDAIMVIEHPDGTKTVDIGGEGPLTDSDIQKLIQAAAEDKLIDPSEPVLDEQVREGASSVEEISKGQNNQTVKTDLDQKSSAQAGVELPVEQTSGSQSLAAKIKEQPVTEPALSLAEQIEEPRKKTGGSPNFARRQ